MCYDCHAGNESYCQHHLKPLKCSTDGKYPPYCYTKFDKNGTSKGIHGCIYPKPPINQTCPTSQDNATMNCYCDWNRCNGIGWNPLPTDITTPDPDDTTTQRPTKPTTASSDANELMGKTHYTKLLFLSLVIKYLHF